jgi:hypothetical protein
MRMIGVQRSAVSLVANTQQKAGIPRYSRGHRDDADVSAPDAARRAFSSPTMRARPMIFVGCRTIASAT